MKKIIALSLASALAACGGGFDDLDAAREGGSGIGSSGSDNITPTKPDEKPNWQYSSTSNSDGIFSLKANNYALNFFYDPKLINVKHKPWVDLEKRRSSSGAVTSTVKIFVDATLSCTPSCKVGMTFDGNRATYEMRSGIDGVIVPINDFTEKQLFNKFTSSNRAIVSLPIINLPAPFDANFDLRGYNLKRMSF